MKNIIEYIKDKSYYLLGGIVIVIILLIIINACSNSSGSYDKIEQKMVNAAKSYYASHKKNLPKEENGTVTVTISTLIESELLKEVKDPKNKEQTCEGFVQVKKVGDDYAYIPFLTCKGNYEPEYLVDKIKNSKLDEYGNGVYEMGGEYVYRGDDVNNYITFNNQTWRIIKIDSDGDIELVYSPEKNNERFAWDTDYNSSVEKYYGVTTDYLHSDIRKTLVEFYENNFSDESKVYIVPKSICVGKKTLASDANAIEECTVTKSDEYVGLLRVSDYPRASLDSGCTRYDAPDCSNRNYFVGSGIDTWLLTSVSDNSYQVYLLDNGIDYNRAYKLNKINPVIYITKDAIVNGGDGSASNEYVLK